MSIMNAGVHRMSRRDNEALIMRIDFIVRNVQRKLQSYKHREL